MQTLELVGYTADLTCLVMADPIGGQRYRVPADRQLVETLAELLELVGDEARLEILKSLADKAGSTAQQRVPEADGPSAAAALVALGRIGSGRPAPRADGSASRLTPSEIQRMLRAGRSPEAVADQAGVALDWVMRWYQPIAAEQEKVATSVRGSRQERAGFGLSDDLIGDAVRINLMARDLDEGTSWSASRPDGRPYWTVVLRFGEGERIRRATWRYDIGTGRVTPRDDMAADLGWTAPVTHPMPGRPHHGHQHAEEDVAPPPPRAAPTPPAARSPQRWAAPTPPGRPRPPGFPPRPPAT